MYTYPENLSTFSKFIEHQKKRGNIKRQKVELNTDSLNAEQRLGLAIVQKVLENNGDQLLMYLHGVAGTGKSHLLACIRDLIESKCGEDGVIVAAPTGVAAYNINGETLHSAFALGLRFMSAREEEEGHLTLIPALTPATELVQHVDSEKLKEQSIDFEKDEEMEVEREVTRKLRVRLQSTRFIIIDEISMVGAKAFAAIERKIRVLLNSTLPFGGRHVIISGDIGQLRPIYDAPLFAEQYLKHGRECLIGMRLYHEFRTVVILHQVVRQEGEEQARFRTLLLNVRKGVFEEEDLHLLNTRQVAKIDENEKKCLDSITHIFPYRRLVKHQNRFAIFLVH